MDQVAKKKDREDETYFCPISFEPMGPAELPTALGLLRRELHTLAESGLGRVRVFCLERLDPAVVGLGDVGRVEVGAEGEEGDEEPSRH